MICAGIGPFRAQIYGFRCSEAVAVCTGPSNCSEAGADSGAPVASPQELLHSAASPELRAPTRAVAARDVDVPGENGVQVTVCVPQVR